VVCCQSISLCDLAHARGDVSAVHKATGVSIPRCYKGLKEIESEDKLDRGHVQYCKCYLFLLPNSAICMGGGESLHPEGILPEFHQTLGAGKNLAGHSAGTRGKRPMAYAAGG